jgi:hypothetical protein
MISGKNFEVHINTPILVDSKAIEDACAFALNSVAEAMSADIRQNRETTFADTSTHNTIVHYGGKSAYYSSGMVPVWQGGLVGSFKVIGPEGSFQVNMKFTMPYAELIESGGVGVGTAPGRWVKSKINANWDENQETILAEVEAHPFTGTVAFKLQQNLPNYGYLEAFGNAFVSQFR